MFCEIYDENSTLLHSFPITYFSERINEDSELITLSLLFKLPLSEEGYVADDAIEDFSSLTVTNVGKIRIYETENKMIAQYVKYHRCSGVSGQYNPVNASGVEGVITFTRFN